MLTPIAFFNHGSTSSNGCSDSDSDLGSDSDSVSDPESDDDSDPESDSNSDSDADSNSGSSGSGSDHGSDSSSSNAEGDSELETTQEDQRIQAWQKISRTIAAAQKRNIRHDAAEVAKSSIPFENGDELQAYTLALDGALASGEYPAGFGLNEEYESVESYKTGRSSKPLIIPLPYEVWFPRIVVWCKALDLLKRLPICKAAAVSLE